MDGKDNNAADADAAGGDDDDAGDDDDDDDDDVDDGDGDDVDDGDDAVAAVGGRDHLVPVHDRAATDVASQGLQRDLPGELVWK